MHDYMGLILFVLGAIVALAVAFKVIEVELSIIHDTWPILALLLLFIFPPIGIILLILFVINCVCEENYNDNDNAKNDYKKQTEKKPICSYCGGAVEKWAEAKYSHNGRKFCSPYCYERFQNKFKTRQRH